MSQAPQPTPAQANADTLDYNPFVSPQRENPHPTLAQARREQPIFYSRSLGVWVVTRYADIAAILRDPERFSSLKSITNNPQLPPPEILAVLQQGFPDAPSLVNNDPPDHSRFRALVNKGFSPRRVANEEPAIRAMAHGLVDSFAHLGEGDLVQQFAYPLPTMVIADLFGVPKEDMEKFKHWSDEWPILLAGQEPLERLVESAHHFVAFQRYIAGLLEARRAAPRDDMLTDILTAGEEQNPPVTLPEFVSMVLQMLFAGHETTTGLITSTIMLLLQNPAQLAAVRANPALIPNTIEEAMRLESPIHGMFRTATTDVQVGDVALPKGSHLYLLYASANRDATVFPNPDQFDIHRSQISNHLSFGRGIHFCIGAALARLEARVAVEVLLQRLPNLRLVPEQQILPMVSLTVRGWQHLHLNWDA